MSLEILLRSKRNADITKNIKRQVQKLTTIYDIAKKANVSPMTVSRVINNKENISEKTRKRVEEVIKELNYIPNSVAQSLNHKKTKLLSLIITDITNPFFTNVARGAADKADQMGYQLIINNTDEKLEKESDSIDALISRCIDGVVIAPTGNLSVKNLKKLARNKIPFIVIDRGVEGVLSDQVSGDNYEGAKILLQHLVDYGHRSIAMIHGPLTISTSVARYQSYIDTLKINDLDIDPSLIIETTYKREQDWNGLDELIDLHPSNRPTAIFAENNFIAIKVIKRLQEKSIKIPEEIAVVCFDELELNSEFSSFLTVVAQPAYEFGYLGIQLLIDRIEGVGPVDYRTVTLKPELVIRQSSGSHM